MEWRTTVLFTKFSFFISKEKKKRKTHLYVWGVKKSRGLERRMLSKTSAKLEKWIIFPMWVSIKHLIEWANCSYFPPVRYYPFYSYQAKFFYICSIFFLPPIFLHLLPFTYFPSFFPSTYNPPLNSLLFSPVIFPAASFPSFTSLHLFPYTYFPLSTSLHLFPPTDFPSLMSLHIFFFIQSLLHFPKQSFTLNPLHLLRCLCIIFQLIHHGLYFLFLFLFLDTFTISFTSTFTLIFPFVFTIRFASVFTFKYSHVFHMYFYFYSYAYICIHLYIYTNIYMYNYIYICLYICFYLIIFTGISFFVPIFYCSFHYFKNLLLFVSVLFRTAWLCDCFVKKCVSFCSDKERF